MPPQFDKHETRTPKNGAHAAIQGDSVTLSGLPAELAGMRAQIAAEPHFDAEKVEAIKAAIREGRLAIDAEAIADKLLASVEELLNPPH